MKDYKEIAAEVFSRRDEYLIKQKKRRKTVAAASLCVALCVVIGVAAGYGRIGDHDGGIVGGTEASGIDSIMATPTVQTAVPSEPDSGHDPDKYVSGFDPDINYGNLGGPYNGTTGSAADRAGVATSELVVYAQVTAFDQIGTDIICTLSVEKTLKGDESDTVSFNISEKDREGFMALVKGEKGVFFLSEGEHGLVLTHGGTSIFYEAGEDDFRSYDETGLICYYLTMEEIENLTEAGL